LIAARSEELERQGAKRRSQSQITRIVDQQSNVANASASDSVFYCRRLTVRPSRNGVALESPESRKSADERRTTRCDSTDGVDRCAPRPIRVAL
jgi:hypothetical protein